MSDFITNGHDLSAIRRLHRGEDYYERRNAERQAAKEAEKQRVEAEKQRAEAAKHPTTMDPAVQAVWEEWFRGRFREEVNSSLCEQMGKAIGECLGEARRDIHTHYDKKIAKLEAKIEKLETQLSLNARFNELESTRRAGRKRRKGRPRRCG